MTLYIVITKDRPSGGGPSTYHVQLRTRKAGQPEMQSRKERDPSGAQRTAERLFGPLEWMSREQAGLDGQPFVVQVAELALNA